MKLFAELSELGAVEYVSRALVSHPLLYALYSLCQVPANSTHLREHAAAVPEEGRFDCVVLLIVRYLITHT